MVSRRLRASCALLAWTVLIEPSWPVFIACSMSRASPPRHSPTMIRSGRMRSELRTRSRISIAPLPSTFGGRDSRRMTWSCRSCSSAASSMVTILSSGGMKLERMFSSVVLPEDVPPETSTLNLARTAERRNRTMSAVALPTSMRSSGVSLSRENFLMVMQGPSSASGGRTSRSLASHIGELSSTRRPTVLTTRSMTCRS